MVDWVARPQVRFRLPVRRARIGRLLGAADFPPRLAATDSGVGGREDGLRRCAMGILAALVAVADVVRATVGVRRDPSGLFLRFRVPLRTVRTRLEREVLVLMRTPRALTRLLLRPRLLTDSLALLEAGPCCRADLAALTAGWRLAAGDQTNRAVSRCSRIDDR